MDTSNLFVAIVEDSNGSYTHVELNEQTGEYEVKHHFKYPWPFHYGYIENTMVVSDEDPLDVAIFGDFPSFTGQKLVVRVIGVAVIKDGDHKVFAINPDDSQFVMCQEYLEIPEELRRKSEGIFARGGHEIEKRLTSIESIEFIKKHVQK